MPAATRLIRAALAAVLAAAAVSAAAPAGAVAPPSTAGLAWRPHVGATLPTQAVVRDSDGRALRLGAILAARPTIIDLGYFHCPSLCGVARDSLIAGLHDAKLHAGTDYTLLALSIDPAETPADAARAKAADLARAGGAGGAGIGAAGGWHYATADAPTIDAVADAVGFPRRWDAVLRQFLHPTGLVIAAPDGRIASYLLGVGYQPGTLRAALARARAGEIAPPPSPVLLLCFHFDQTTGRYTFAIMKAIRVAALATVLGILGLLLLLRRVRRRHIARP